eukprot:TRINITY_DN30538_c0_g1_i1.p1 TRINITY_DN30538_c0_g1~~TRINITY_DN30538_c0_g1_i1.p1  ORF type:complete len:1036 (-),score=209.27 TRINITY_DN30538_c0_g1_i1:224-3331(-)
MKEGEEISCVVDLEKESAKDSMPGGDAEARYLNARASGKITVISKTGCTFCSRAKFLLEDLVEPDRLVTIECDEVPGGAALRKMAQQDSGVNHNTVPMIFIGDKFVGGCDSLMALKQGGELYARLGVAPKSSTLATNSVRKRPPCPFPLFYFPHTVNSWVVRGVALQAVIICIVSAIFRDEPWTRWLMTFLAIDFAVRFYAGAFASPLGGLSMMMTAGFQERLTSGAQKQFATGIGVVFASTAAGLFLAGQDVAGAVVCICLAGPAALEAFFDFCVGCVFFRYLIQFGIVPDTVNDMHIGQKALVAAQLEHADDRSTPLAPLQEYVHRQPGQPHTPADLRVKAHKLDDHKRRGFHPIKQVQVADFMMPLGLVGLALPWKMLTYAPQFFHDGQPKGIKGTAAETVWKIIFWTAVVISVLLLLLLIAKVILYRHKFVSELRHPLKSNAVAAGPTTLVLLAFVIFQYDGEATDDSYKWLAVVLFWTGAVMLKLLMVWKLAALVAYRGDSELAIPQILLPLAGCMAAALVAPFLQPWWGSEEFVEVGWFFFGLSGLLLVLLVGGTFLESVRYHWSDERIRPSVGMWVVALHMTFVAYVVLTQGPSALLQPDELDESPWARPPVVLDAFAKTLYFAGLSIFLVLLSLAVPMGFLLKLKFDFSFWALAFPLDLLCLATMLYHKSTIRPGERLQPLSAEFSNVMVYVTLFLATYGNATLLFSTFYWLMKKRWLRPNMKWAPLSLNKLTHEAFRAAGQRMAFMAEALKNAEEGKKLKLAHGLAVEWEEYAVSLEWHADQEDKIMFREIDAFNPLAARHGYEQHEMLEKMELCMNAAAAKLKSASSWSSEVQDACRTFTEQMADYVPFMCKHMDWEEQNLLALNRRTFNMAIQIRIVKKIWDAYEGLSVQEFRAPHAGSMHAPSTPGKQSWEQAAFQRTGRRTPPKKDVSFEQLLAFPSEFPQGEMPLEQKQVWRVVLPYVVRNLPEPMMRTRFVRCWTWAMPERAQHIGEMIYRGVEDHEWNALATDVPEIIPRGLPGWIRRI